MEKEIVICLNCSHIQELKEDKVYEDEMGRFTVCEDCECSFDIPNELEKERQNKK